MYGAHAGHRHGVRGDYAGLPRNLNGDKCSESAANDQTVEGGQRRRKQEDGLPLTSPQPRFARL